VPEILVLGGTGKTGRRVVQQLAAQGVAVRAASRRPAGRTTDGVRPVHFDWDDSATHAPALAGVEAVYVVPPAFVLDATGHVPPFLKAVEAAGVPRAVLLSARGVDADDAVPLRRIELALAGGGLGWSVLRPSWFAQNFTEGAFAPAVQAGVLAMPTGEGREPFIDADDIAAVAVRLLLDPGLDGRAYDLSGPEAITFEQAASVLAGALGRPVRFQHVSADQWLEQTTAAGVPADYAAFLAAMLDGIRQGRDAHVSDGVRAVLGRPARSFEDWAATL
jgi:uncharacterized protein YbjT (DUF2867 family)